MQILLALSVERCGGMFLSRVATNINYIHIRMTSGSKRDISFVVWKGQLTEPLCGVKAKILLSPVPD
jgi:hypothetical protein